MTPALLLAVSNDYSLTISPSTQVLKKSLVFML